MRRRTKTPPDAGIVLVLTLALVALLTVLILSLAALVRLETRVSENVASAARARAQALAALDIAIGQLQRYAGPDARVTMTADRSLPNVAWVGVWDADDEVRDPLVWLVSGNEREPLAQRPEQAVPAPSPDLASPTVWLLRRRIPDSRAEERVKLPKIEVRGRSVAVAGRAVIGRFAYWISDEAGKLSVNDSAEPPEGVPAGETTSRLQEVFEGALPAEEDRTRIRLLDQSIEAGLDAATVRRLWPDLTARADGVRDVQGVTRLVPAVFNVNAQADPGIWRAVFAAAEPELPEETRASPAALAVWYLDLQHLRETAPRPFRSVGAFRTTLTAALPEGTRVEAFWGRIESRLVVRGDTFLVRAYGEAVNPARPRDEDVEAVAYLEALVQRTPGLHDKAPFGRVFRVQYVRWLSAEDV